MTNFALFLSVLPKALLGWAGVFVVTLVIVAMITLLGRIGAKRADK